ncbi:RnfABCDGE type electron transport complex subunit D [Nostoc sp. 'Peltigera membranacea cyanobiont' 232]|uniref:RnfABCDGE type electron transport complex subunit D n=2 Tax=unclassified Nostoc TaxID=2593658 RepID=UPI000B9554C4|nr:RnfABCDGE type electron transport complex subunit D [Nostoc sp. 'Peltigera membranacea cyanobiont' 232]OYE03222.1 Na+-transporting NADH:ubiquinone oxidoreductase, subunit NqrB [Nostoc sp. 'Peltigera membranacea cyanobiont' 232]
MLLKDIRDYQILFLGLFLVLGIGTRDWTLRPELIGVAIATSLATQWILSLVTGKEQMANLRSALITSLGLSLLLRADCWTTMAIAAVIAIASKFIFQVGDKHFFNPTNFGIISALILTPDAWVSPGQWGEEWWYGLLFAGTGGMILQRVGRWDTTAAFLGSYSLLEAIRNLWLGWTWDVYWHRLMSGSLLLFALFMITDPRSIPNSRIGRVVWAICIAGLTFILRNYFFISTAVFWALFALAPLTILLDVLWLAPRFSWQEADEEAGTELLLVQTRFIASLIKNAEV